MALGGWERQGNRQKGQAFCLVYFFTSSLSSFNRTGSLE